MSYKKRNVILPKIPCQCRRCVLERVLGRIEAGAIRDIVDFWQEGHNEHGYYSARRLIEEAYRD